MKAKLNRFLKSLIIFSFATILFIFNVATVKAQAGCTTSNVTGEAVSYSQGVASIEVSGCVDNSRNYSYEYIVIDQGSIKRLDNLNVAIGKGNFSNTIEVLIPEGTTHLQVILRSRTGTEGEIARSTAGSIPIPGISAPVPDPENANLDLTNTFLGGAGSSTQIKDIYASPANLVNVIIRNLFVFAGLILFVNILWAGFKFITQEAKGKDEAKSIMTVSIVGFILMFVAYWIVQIIGVVTGMQLVQ